MHLKHCYDCIRIIHPLSLVVVGIVILQLQLLYAAVRRYDIIIIITFMRPII